MKRILSGLILIAGASAALYIGATGAFFSDVEASTGNIFVAGSIDLKVDHKSQTYNGEECGGCNKVIVSDSNTVVVEKGNAPAVHLTFQHAQWTADLDGGHLGGPPNDGLNDNSFWIWAVNGVENPTQDETYTFQRTFLWNGPLTTGTLYVASDNSHVARVNGVQVGIAPEEQNFRSTDEDVYTVVAIITPGLNTIEIEVKNWGLAGSTPTSNPAGLLFKLVIDGDCNENGFPQGGGICKLWKEKDLEPGDTFWNFDDVKPGDHGTNVLSFHVSDNDAYMCLLVHDIEDNENTHLQVEIDAGDNTSGPGNGELSQFLELFIWDDGAAGDGVYDPNTEDGLYEGPFTTVVMERLSLTATTISYVGIAWCFGNQTVDHSTGAITCDGSGDHNVAQTDSVIASLTAYAVQQRHNAGFNCADVDLGNGDNGNGGNGGAGLPFSDGFDQAINTDTTFNESPAWQEGGAGATKQAAGEANNSPSPNGGRFALMSGTDGWICREIDATGFNTLILNYYWRGDQHAENTDRGIVEFKIGGACTDAAGWATVGDHDMSVDSDWSFVSTGALSPSADNGPFLLRFRNNSSDSNEDFRVDGVSITGTTI